MPVVFLTLEPYAVNAGVQKGFFVQFKKHGDFLDLNLHVVKCVLGLDLLLREGVLHPSLEYNQLRFEFLVVVTQF
jgi:hypothetical protein